MHALAIIYIVLAMIHLLTLAARQETASALFSLVAWFTALALAIVVLAS